MLPLNTDVTIYTAYLVFSFYVCFFFLFCLFIIFFFFFFSSRRRHTRLTCDWSSDVCSSDLQVDGDRDPKSRRSSDSTATGWSDRSQTQLPRSLEVSVTRTCSVMSWATSSCSARTSFKSRS